MYFFVNKYLISFISKILNFTYILINKNLTFPFNLSLFSFHERLDYFSLTKFNSEGLEKMWNSCKSAVPTLVPRPSTAPGLGLLRFLRTSG